MTLSTLKVAVCLFNDVVNTDYTLPCELFSFFSREAEKTGLVKPPLLLEPTYLAYSRESFRGSFVGPKIVPDKAYGEIKSDEQFDIILVPGG